MRLNILLGAAAFLATATPVLAQDCAEWGQQVALTGILVDGIYPGPPEYESVSNGDAAYNALMLHLQTPICVDGSDELGAELVASTELVQLACNEEQIADMTRGERIAVSGVLFSAHTGYHVTPALLQCQ